MSFYSIVASSERIFRRLDDFEKQFQRVKTAVVEFSVLEAKFIAMPQDQLELALEQCRAHLQEAELQTASIELKEITSITLRTLEQLHLRALVVASPADPKYALLLIASDFQYHHSVHAKETFSRIEKTFPRLSVQIYDNLCRLLGMSKHHRSNSGQRAFYDREGFFSLDSEKAEAIYQVYETVEKRLQDIVDLFKSGKDLEAIKRFGHFKTVYPVLANSVYDNLWKIYGEPTPQTNSRLAIDQFGMVVFHNGHHSIISEPIKKAQSLERVIADVEEQLINPKLATQQMRLRRKARCCEVIQEHVAILKQGFYFAPSGERRDIAESVQNSIIATKIYRDGGPPDRKVSRFKSTLLEVRPQNCVTIAYELAIAEEDVNIMNFANADGPGGDYLRSRGSQEEELFRCTALPLVLDKKHHKQKLSFYPIDVKAGAFGGIYTPTLLLLRTGFDSDYRVHEQPMTISVGTFPALKKPNLDYSDPKNPRLQGEQLRQTREKIRTYLKSAYDYSDKNLVMGAFGCGSFGNPPQHIAEIMMELIETEYQNCFKKIIFAVMKDSEDGDKHNPRGNFAPFAEIVKSRGGNVYKLNGELL